MPIFQDDLDHHGPCQLNHSQRFSATTAHLGLRRLSEESLPEELCEGPVPDSPGRPSTPRMDDEAAISCRAELIERLKRGESPTWVPNRHIENIYPRCDPAAVLRTSPQPPRLLSPMQITSDVADSNETKHAMDQRMQAGLNIERPRSALHSGDFTISQTDHERRSSHQTPKQRVDAPLPSDATWIATSPPRDFAPFQYDRRIPFQAEQRSGFRSVTASPLSSSLSSSFAYHAPTSPLVQSESNDELGFSMASRSFEVSSRDVKWKRHTPNPVGTMHLASPSARPLGSRLSSGRRDGSLPYQAHQPRRSLSSTPTFALSGASPPASAFSRVRRPSFGSESSPIQHASMVGSYEESILKGRMSTTPSKPFDFLAQIGVLGKGKCKPSLRCPAHVTLPFAAVYYSYNNTPHGRSRSDDGPSPYVGQVDLENGLPNAEEESRSRRKAQGRYLDRHSTNQDVEVMMRDSDTDHEGTKPPRTRRRAGCSKAPPGGSYRLPEKGQIQIIIKNQNKTAVKLFLVPYDLTGMEPGTKTFIRQRSYSAGPVVDHVPNPSEKDAQSRAMLRYLVHFHICCPSKGRFYLYKSIRVVFANRVPEGKEKLRNETTWPEPRFSPYKPIRAMNSPLSISSGPGAMLAAEKAYRRRSLGTSFGGISSRAFGMVDGPAISGGGNTKPVEPIPFRLPAQDREDCDMSDATSMTAAGIRSPDSSQASRPSTKDSAGLSPWHGEGSSQWEKLSRGDAGYGGIAFGSLAGTRIPSGTEGLLSQRLRSLGVNKPQPPESAEDLA